MTPAAWFGHRQKKVSCEDYEMAPEHPVPRKLWENPNPEQAQIWKFMRSLEQAYGTKLPVWK